MIKGADTLMLSALFFNDRIFLIHHHKALDFNRKTISLIWFKDEHELATEFVEKIQLNIIIRLFLNEIGIVDKKSKLPIFDP